MATLSSILPPGNVTTANNTQTLTNKTLTGAAMNGTLGATTPSTGVFTTLAIGTNSGFGGSLAQFNGANVAQAATSGQVTIGSSDVAAADKGGSLGFTANTTSLAGYSMGQISARLYATGAGVYRSYMGFTTTDTGGTVAERMRLNDAGLAVTGTGTTSGNFGAGAAADGTFALLASSTTQRSQLTLKGSNVTGLRFQSTDINSGERNWGLANNIDAQGSLSVRYGASQGADPTTTVAQFSSTGLAVTGVGTFSSLNGITIGGGFHIACADSSSNRLWLGESSHTNVGLRILSTGTSSVSVDGYTYNSASKPISFDGNAAGCSFGGNLSVGGATGTTARLQVTSDGSNWTSCFQTSSTGSYGQIAFRNPNGVVGGIDTSGSSTIYNTSSDYRLKNITGLLTDSGTFIDALKPKVGTWKTDGSKFVGFLAHEFAEVSPGSVKGTKDEMDSDGNPVHQAMQASTSEVIANLVAELQSLRKRLAALESK